MWKDDLVLLFHQNKELKRIELYMVDGAKIIYDGTGFK